jgi:integrase/recombinase XerD
VATKTRSKSKTPDLPALLPSWLLSLRAARKSSATVSTYRDGILGFLRWADEAGVPAVLDKPTVGTFVVSLLDSGRSASTASIRLQALKRFSAWAVDEGELDEDRLVGIKRPRLDSPVVEMITDDEVRRLIKACSGNTFVDRRDAALVRLLAETGLRASEVINLTVGDVDLATGQAIIRNGKGGKGRVVAFGPETALALDRYMRLRRSHRLASTPALFLGDRGKAFSYSGLYSALVRRAEAAGIVGFHPHRLRHGFASRWLRNGGSEGGLMSAAGWRNRNMIDRYSASDRATRAIDEARGLGLGDF